MPLDDDKGRKIRVGDLVILRVMVTTIINNDEVAYRIMSSRIVEEGLTPRMTPINPRPN